MYDSNDYLAHHGILGQKWGVRRYQNKDGSLTAEGRKRAGLKPEKKFAKLRSDAAKKRAAKKAEKDLADKENLKKFLRKHPEQLYRHSTELTREDAEEIIKNIEFDRKLKDVRDAEIQRGWDKVKSIANNAGTVANLFENSKKIYNLSTEVYNALVDSGKIKGERKLKIGEKPEEPKEDKSAREAYISSLKPEYVKNNHTKFTGEELANYVKRQNSLESLNKIINPPSEKEDKKGNMKDNSTNNITNAKKVDSQKWVTKQKVSTSSDWYETKKPSSKTEKSVEKILSNLSKTDSWYDTNAKTDSWYKTNSNSKEVESITTKIMKDLPKTNSWYSSNNDWYDANETVSDLPKASSWYSSLDDLNRKK